LTLRWKDPRDGREYQVRVVGWGTIAFWDTDGFWTTECTTQKAVEDMTDDELQALLDAARTAPA
jgi:hypothetical protein